MKKTVKEVREIVTDRVIDCSSEKVLFMEVEKYRCSFDIKTIVKGTHDRVFLYKHCFDRLENELYCIGFYECSFNDCVGITNNKLQEML